MAVQSVRINIFRSRDEISKKCGKVCLAPNKLSHLVCLLFSFRYESPVGCLQVVVVGGSLEDTLQLASDKFGEEVVEMQTPHGSNVDDVSILRQALHPL